MSSPRQLLAPPPHRTIGRS
ncbi:hypothetical protein E2C01_091163 [Portunus trituberculatus]|uniref:Uncharacterized protein n=1 Tax=Portunus trituberculatus TaxID=210409 RepID=A0A5B7JUB0_PORTR|nr:hypothetical protein [Portunus trituberculatus]